MIKEKLKPENTVSYYKCVSHDYYTFDKGSIYSSESIGIYLTKHPKDWKKVLPYPSTIELLDAFEKNVKKSQVIKALNQWRKK